MFNNNLQESASLHKPPSPLPFPHLVSIESIPFPFPPVHHHRHQTPIGSDPPLPTRHQANGDRYQHQANAKLHSTRRRPRKDFGSDPPRSPRHRRSPPKMVFVFIIIKLPPIAKAMQGRVIAPMADLDKGKSVYASRDLPIAGNGSRKRLLEGQSSGLKNLQWQLSCLRTRDSRTLLQIHSFHSDFLLLQLLFCELFMMLTSTMIVLVLLMIWIFKNNVFVPKKKKSSFFGVWFFCLCCDGVLTRF